MCSDRVSCHRNASACIDLTNSCSAGFVKCRSGACVTRFENCPTDVSCSSGVLCGDGSCRATKDECTREQTLCPSSLPYRCPDGSCRFSFSDCPTQRTCPTGWSKCENGWCVANIDSCKLWKAATNGCPMNTTRCADSSCAPNGLLCPTASTCPVGLIRCADGSCVTDLQSCNKPSRCHPLRPFMCPDGSCAISSSSCPTGRTCGIQHPVKCSDGSCAASASQCPLVCADGRLSTTGDCPSSAWICPSHTPIRCSDGSCVTSVLHCPIEPQCPSVSPIRCADGRCVVSADVCLPRPDYPAFGSSALVNALKCPSHRPVRCPSGDCAESRAFCPSVQSCPLDQTRCVDGTCRTSCPVMSDLCPSQYIQCPQAFQGIACAKSIAECPSAPICPPHTPIKCGDSSCAASLNDCPNVWHPSDLSKTFSINAAPCANGGWAISAPACSSATVCPPWSPVKCWDDSCRALAEDCPPTTKCDASTPYLCVDGTCRERPDSACGQGVVCTNSDRPLKCPLGIDGNLCVANSSQCLDIRSYTPTKACDNTESCTGCSDSRKRCRSGNCVLVKDRCADVLCPAHLPFNCSSGLCARNENECDNDGCPYDAPQKCPDGACVGKDVDCTKDHNAPACGGQKACDDGSCPDSTGKCPLKNGCPEKKYRCWDKSCSDTADGCLDKLDTHNACPYNRPYRCADGYCALSSSVCPIIPSMTDICGVSPSGEAKRFRCADGSCALYQEQCPVVRPCLMNEERCGDGSCRSKGACPAANTCPTDRPTRCPSGLCASSLDACIDELTGCPKNKVKCGDGSCQDSYAQCVNPIGNGCSSTNPFKCSNGECVKTVAECKLPNGCLAATPYRCSDGSCSATSCSVDGNCPANFYRCEDGRCVGQNSQCQLPNGCPASTPIRCASGNCASLPAAVGLDSTTACPAVVVCDSLQPYRCADGSCAPSSKHCRPLWSCPSGYQWCAVNNTCITSSQLCPSSCPPSSPTLCPDGSCRKSSAFCAKSPQCPADTPVACYDGSCRKSSTDCVKSKLTSLRSSLSSQLDDGFAPENVTCPVIGGLRSIMCHDARCVAYDWQCALVPACPELKSQRCLDGSCVSYNDTCKEVAACKDGTIRCEDGLCRSFCLPFAGCPNRGKRFYCPGRKDACVADPKDCRTINIDGTITELSPPSDDALLAAFSETGTKLLPGQEVCGKNCQRNNPATPQSVAVSPVAPATIDVSFDDRGSPRARLVVSAGAFDRPTTLSIVPRSLTQINRNNFLFGEKIVSTPFACSPISASSQLMAITAEASVDRVLYDPTSIVNGETVLQTPCFARSTSKLAVDGQFSVSPSSNNVNASRQCKGVLKISATSLEFRLNAAVDCSEQVDIKGTFLGFPTTQTNKPYTNNEGSRCMCWNVTESFGNDPLYRAGGLFCGVVARNDIQSPRYTFRSFYKASRIQREYDDPINGDPCPNNANTDEARYTDLSLSDPPACPPETGVIGVNRVAPKDICLGRLDPITDQWSCVKGDYQSRVANPPYRSGNPYWMSSSLVQCDGSSYAFVQIDMPPPPPPPENVCGWWCQYWKYVVGITVGVGGFGLVAAYASSRLVRYRKKYRETKQKNIELHERRKELDEFAGGLGIADDDGEVAMVANPLVIEMQELEQQMKRVNEELKTDQQKEVREIDQLDIERQRLQAEIERVRSLLAQQQKTKAPTRMSDAPLTFAPRPGIPANTATVNPGLGYSSPVVPSGPAMGRQDFGQVRGPSRKKQID